MRTAKTTHFVSLATYAANRPVTGQVVTLLDSTHESRGLKLIPTYSRALPKHSIHELIATDEVDRKPGDTAQRIAYLAFFEVTRGGCVIVGDTLLWNGKAVGTVIIGVDRRQTGRQLRFSVGQNIRFVRRGKRAPQS